MPRQPVAIKRGTTPNNQRRPPMNIVRKLVLSLVALAAFLLCVAVPRPQAKDQDRCQCRVAHAEHELHRGD